MMRMLGNPLGQFDFQPKAINTTGNNGQEPPLDPIPKKLHSGTVKVKAVPVNNCMFYLPIIQNTHAQGAQIPSVKTVIKVAKIT